MKANLSESYMNEHMFPILNNTNSCNNRALEAFIVMHSHKMFMVLLTTFKADVPWGFPKSAVILRAYNFRIKLYLAFILVLKFLRPHRPGRHLCITTKSASTCTNTQS